MSTIVQHRFNVDRITGQNRGLICTIDGKEPPMIVAARTVRGFDQEMATAEIVHANVFPDEVKEGSRCILWMGNPESDEPNAGMQIRFTGYVETFSNTLYPGRQTAVCKDMLWLTSRDRPNEEISMVGMTDIEAITYILSRMYYPNMLDIQGTGLKLGDVDDIALYWEPGVPGLKRIQEIDLIGQGWRTFATTDGRIVRRPISVLPYELPAYSFVQGINIVDGSMETSNEDPYDEVTINSPAGEFTYDLTEPGADPPPFYWHSNPYWVRYYQLQQIASSLTYLNAEDQAAWLYTQLAKKLVRGTFTTFSDRCFQGSETIDVSSGHMEVNQRTFLQNIQSAVEESGKFSQEIQYLSQRDGNNRGVVNPWSIDPTIKADAGPIAPIAPVQLAPSNASVMANFTIVSVIRELVIRGGVETTIYHVSCKDTSYSYAGTIASRAWTATGGNATTLTGTGEYFSTTFDDLATSSITLDVTDSNAFTGTVTRQMDQMGVEPMVRELYAGSDTQFEAFDGAVWRTYTPSNNAPITAIAEGPMAAAEEIVMVTADNLQTAATESTPFGAAPEIVRSLWNEPDVDTGFASGSDNGDVALAPDGSTWTVTTPPGGSPVRRLIISRFHPEQIHAITDTGYWVSDNSGSGWRLIRAGDFEDLQLAAHSWNIVVTAAGGLETAEGGTPFTFPVLVPAVHIVAATHHIRLKGVYAMDDEGRTFYTAVYGSMALVQGADIPAGEAQLRGIYRDGTAVGKIYCALGTGGLAEHTNGFEDAEGWELVRDGTVPWP